MNGEQNASPRTTAPIDEARAGVPGHLLDGETHDRRLARATLSMTPAQRLRNLSNMWPLARTHQTIAARRRERAGA